MSEPPEFATAPNSPRNVPGSFSSPPHSMPSAVFDVVPVETVATPAAYQTPATKKVSDLEAGPLIARSIRDGKRARQDRVAPYPARKAWVARKVISYFHEYHMHILNLKQLFHDNEALASTVTRVSQSYL